MYYTLYGMLMRARAVKPSVLNWLRFNLISTCTFPESNVAHSFFLILWVRIQHIGIVPRLPAAHAAPAESHCPVLLGVAPPTPPAIALLCASTAPDPNHGIASAGCGFGSSHWSIQICRWGQVFISNSTPSPNGVFRRVSGKDTILTINIFLVDRPHERVAMGGGYYLSSWKSRLVSKYLEGISVSISFGQGFFSASIWQFG